MNFVSPDPLNDPKQIICHYLFSYVKYDFQDGRHIHIF